MSKSKKFSNIRKLAAGDRSGTFISSAPHLRTLAGIAIIVVVAAIAYFPSLNGGFIWDDNSLLVDNPSIKASDGLYRLWFTTETIDYWPATYTTFWIEWRLWGRNPTGYHVTNLILHIVESLLIWIVLRKLSIPGAFLAAVIFALHPVNVESIAWIAQRKNTMVMLFFLLSILFYLEFLRLSRRPTDHASHGARRCPLAAKQIPSTDHCPPTTSSFIPHPSSFHIWYWLSLAAFVFAMLSKGSAAVLPALLLGIVWWLRPLTKWDLARTAPFFLVAAVLAGVNVWFQTHGMEEAIRTASFTERLLGAGGIVWFYLYKALLPIDLAFVYPQWRIESGNPLWWLPLTAAFAVTAALWWYRDKWSRPFLFAWGFFCVALLPVMGFTDVFFMRYSLVADHYQHIAIIGIIALAAAGWSIWHRRRRGAVYWAASAIPIIAAGTLAYLTWQQSGLYRDEITLYQDTLQKNPGCWLAHNNLGIVLFRAGRLQEAIEHYRQALTLNSDNSETHYNLGTALLQTGRMQEAIEQCREALRLRPNSPEAHNNLGTALLQTGRPQEAIEHCSEALRLKQNYPEAYYNLGNALVQTGRPGEAIEHYREALRLKADYPEAQNNLANLLVQAGRAQEAIEHYEQALVRKPDYVNAHYNLGGILMKTGRAQEAIEHFKQVLQLRPDHIGAYNDLALAYAQTGQPAEAVAAARNALEIARSQGKTPLAKQIEDWLNSYEAQRAKGEDRGK